MRRSQRGAGGLFVAVLLLIVIGGILATLAFFRSKDQGERSGQDVQRFEKIQSALVQFVAANSRLPCPANPTANPETGTENRTALSATCNSPTGTVPWASLGIRRDDAIDAHGWRISYRVYTGTAGSLTQDGGASTVNCDTNEPWPASLTPVVGSAGGLCRATKDTLETTFLTSAKGLSVTWFGTSITDAAYVLVSHGSSGLGAFTSTVPSVQTPTLPTSASELANLSATGPFVATNASDSSVAPGDSGHFDDLLAYKRISDLVRLAGVGARNWDDTSGADLTMNSTTVAAALGSTPTPGTDLGVTALTFETARVTGLASSGATTQNLTLNATGDGLGTAGGSLDISSSSSEGVRVDLKANFRAFGFTLVQFGTSGGLRETVLVNFYAGTTQVFTATRHGCNVDDASVLASFQFDLGSTDFDRVEIFPQVMVNSAGNPTANPSAFFLSAIRACASGACPTSLETGGNLCTT
jgi:hypothetical protein